MYSGSSDIITDDEGDYEVDWDTITGITPYFDVSSTGRVWATNFSNSYWKTSGRALIGHYEPDIACDPHELYQGGAYEIRMYASDSQNQTPSGYAIVVSDVSNESSPVRNFLVRNNGLTEVTGLTVTALTSGTGSAVVANSNGRLYITSSSKRYKDYIADMTENEAEKLYDLPVVQFKYKDGYLDREDEAYDKPLHGFFAEDVADMFSDGGIHNAAGDVENYSERAIIARLVKLVQMQHREIEQLKQAIS